MFLPSKTRVAVLRGGQSPEYDISLKTGANVLQNLPEKYHGLDVFIDKNGLWHIQGLPKSPEKVLKQVDVVFNALHGGAGEDGRIQQLLQTHGVPFTGSRALPSSFSMNKIKSKQIYLSHGLNTAHYVVVNENNNSAQNLISIFKTFIMPAVVKPANAGSSIGVSIVNTLAELKGAIIKAFKYGDTAMVEEYLSGKEASCGVVENFRDESLYPLLPVEIATPEYICPGNFSFEQKREIEQLAKLAHKVLGLNHYSSSDFIITPRRGIYILETNTLPTLTENSLLAKSLSAGGIHISHFLDHILQLALN